jgi:lactaldehyde dehydrogenase
LATPALAVQAVQAARLASHAMARMPAHERAQRLQEVAESVSQDTDNLATLLSRETGKTLRESRTELGRSVGVLRLCAHEAVQIAGRQIPLDASALGHGGAIQCTC